MVENGSYSLSARIINEWPLESTARILRLPLEDLASKQFITIVNVAYNLWENLKRAASLNSSDPNRYLKYGYLPGEGEPFPRPDGFTPSLEQRYAVALHLDQALIELVAEGFSPDFSAPRSFCSREIEDALSPYGMAVTAGSEPASRVQAEPGLVPPTVKEVGNPQERLCQAAERLEISQEQWQEPAIHQYLGVVLGTENLLIHAQNGWQSTAVKPAVGPAIPERYRTIQGFAEAMLAVLEDGRGGRNLTRAFLRQTLNPALAPYDLHAYRKPTRSVEWGDKDF